MKIIDTHQHLWDLSKLSYSWTANKAILNRSFLIEDYRAALSDHDVIQTVFVEADVDEQFMLDEARWASSYADGIVAACRPERDDFQTHIEQLTSIPNLKGVRRILHTAPDELSQNELFREHIRSLETYGLTFDLCVLARQLPVAIELVKNCPNVNFILDHCGNPDIKNRDYREWNRNLEEIAALPNMIGCKISGIVVNTDIKNWNSEDLRPSINHVLTTFGWNRVMFGSDWPVCTLASSAKRWVDTLLLLVQDANEADKRKLFEENARRIYDIF